MLYGLYYYVTIETTSKCLQLKWNLPWSQSMPEVFLEISLGKRERARGSHHDPVVCMKIRFEVKVTRGFSLSSPLRGSLSLSRIKISRKTSETRVSGTMSRKVSPPLWMYLSLSTHTSRLRLGATGRRVLSPRSPLHLELALTHAPLNVQIFVLRLQTVVPLWSMPATCWKSMLFISCDLTIKAIW